jgi:membrane fusion protein (multidrug efflux system)
MRQAARLFHSFARPKSAMASSSAPMPQESSVSAPVAVVPAARAAAPPRSRRVVILLVVVLVVAAGALSYWLYARRFETTDDAQIDGDISNVSPRTSGNVSAVYVRENQVVKQGDLLAEVDPADLAIALAQAKAQVAQAQAQLQAEDPSVPIILTSNKTAVASAQSDVAAAQAALSAARKDVEQLTAQLAQAQANDRTAQLERGRSEKLVTQGAVSQSDFDNRSNAAAASNASVDALRQSLAAAQDRVRQQQAQMVALQSRVAEITSNAPRQVATRQATVTVRQAELEVANAQLAQAEKNLSYAKILAPVAGTVAKKAVAVGDHVAPGQLVFAISQTEALWVTANYRETQLEKIHAGQSAEVHVDAVDVTLHGTVESIGGTTGSRLSVLPPENASGNYVKVVQRIPVRIALDPQQPGLERLRIGMSVEPKVSLQ